MEKRLSVELYNIIIDLNARHRILEMAWFWFELFDIFEENLKTKNQKYWEHVSEKFYDISTKRIVNHVYDSNSWLYMINSRLWDYFNKYPFIEQEKIYNDIKIDYKTIVSQTNSLIARPNIMEPIQYKDILIEKLEETEDGYIRIWYFEKQLYTNDKHGEWYKEKTVYWWVVFREDSEFPYSRYRVSIEDIYSNTDTSIFNSNENPIESYIQNLDMFENYRILWLNKELIKKMCLKMWDFIKWIYAVNEKNEIILKFSCWSSNYLGIDLKWEIPEFVGSQLLIRKDYFVDFIKIYKNNYFYSIKTSG